MTIPKHEHLIKPLSIGLNNWRDAKQPIMAIGPGNAGQEIMLNGRDHLEGLNLNFSWGVHTGLGDWHAGFDPHVHPYPEVLLFVGLDTANVNYLGAEIDCCLGSELETYTFNEPTAIIIPAGMPHGPIITRRMYSPRGYGFWAIELNQTSEITWLGEGVRTVSADQKKAAPKGMAFAAAEKIIKNRPAEPTGKYSHLVKSLRPYLLIERGIYNASRFTPEQFAEMEDKAQKTGEKPGPGNSDHLIMMSGKDLEGLDVGLFWGFNSRPGLWRRGAGPHVHSNDEVLVFVGTNSEDVEYLGAEIEVDMGKERERFLINKPTVVVCPAGTPHTPLVTRWVDKPFAFFAVNLSGEHQAKPAD